MLVILTAACSSDPAAQITFPDFGTARTVLLGTTEPDGTSLVTAFDLADGRPDFAYRVLDGTALSLAVFEASRDELRLPLGPVAIDGDDRTTERLVEPGRYWTGAIQDARFEGWAETDDRPNVIARVRRPKLCDEITIEDSVVLPFPTSRVSLAPVDADSTIATGVRRGLYVVNRDGTTSALVATNELGYDAVWSDGAGRVFVVGFDRRLERRDAADDFATPHELIAPRSERPFGMPHSIAGGLDGEGGVELFVLTESNVVAYWTETATAWTVAEAGLPDVGGFVGRTSVAWLRSGVALIGAHQNLVRKAEVVGSRLELDEVPISSGVPIDGNAEAVAARPGHEAVVAVSGLGINFLRGDVDGMRYAGGEGLGPGAVQMVAIDESDDIVYVARVGIIGTFPREPCGPEYKLARDGLAGPWLLGPRRAVVAEPTGNDPATVHFFSWRVRDRD